MRNRVRRTVSRQPVIEPAIVSREPSVHLPRIATLYQAIQRDRVGLELSLQRKGDVHDPEAHDVYERLLEIERHVVAYLNRECAKSSIWPWLSSIKGIGPRIGGMLVGLIDIRRADTVSALWRYAGLAVVDGRAERRQKGQRLSYNAMLKKTCYLIARQFIVGGTEPYVSFYRQAKAWYTEHRPGWTKGHVEAAARRKAVKLFLSHLWVQWRTVEGLPVRPPYAHERLGHTTLIEPPRAVGGEA